MLGELYKRMPDGTVTVIAPDEDGADAYDVGTGRPHTLRIRSSASSGSKRIVWPMARAALRRARSGGYDHLHCGHVLMTLPAWVARRRWRLPFIVFAYGSEFTSARLARLRRLCYNAADAVVAISEVSRAELIRRGVHPDRIAIVTPGVDTKTFKPDEVTRRRVRAAMGVDDQMVLLSVGRLHPNARHKGFDTTIAAMGYLSRNSDSHATLMIAGDGPDRSRLQKLVTELDVADRVTFISRASDEHLRALYVAADLFVLASRNEPKPGGGYTTEGFGIVFLEAQASGLPVLAGAVGGALDAVGASSGSLLSNLDAESLAEAILELEHDVQRREEMRRAAREHAVEHFDWSVSSQRLLALSHRVVSSGGATDAPS